MPRDEAGAKSRLPQRGYSRKGQKGEDRESRRMLHGANRIPLIQTPGNRLLAEVGSGVVRRLRHGGSDSRRVDDRAAC